MSYSIYAIGFLSLAVSVLIAFDRWLACLSSGNVIAYGQAIDASSLVLLSLIICALAAVCETLQRRR